MAFGPCMLVLNLPDFENKKYTAYDRFHGNGPYGEIPTKKELIRTLGFALPYNNVLYLSMIKDLNISIVTFGFLFEAFSLSDFC